MPRKVQSNAAKAVAKKPEVVVAVAAKAAPKAAPKAAAAAKAPKAAATKSAEVTVVVEDAKVEAALKKVRLGLLRLRSALEFPNSSWTTCPLRTRRLPLRMMVCSPSMH